MSGNLSKQTMTLIKNALVVNKAVELHGPIAAARLSEQLGGQHDGFKEAAVLAVFDSQRWFLGELGRVLTEREEALGAELGDNPAIRAALGEALAEVRGAVVQGRELSRSLYEPDVVAKMGLAGETPEDASTLLSYGSMASQGLRAQSGKPGRLGVAVDLTPLADALDQALGGLKAAHEAAVADVREDQAARLARDEAFGALRAVYRSAALIIEGYFRQAGLHELADRLRPTERRAQGLEDAPPLDGADLG